jgi:molybdenum cofactor guanylyltransferase
MAATVEVCILAGGLSSRMGQPKARLRLGKLTLLGHARKNAAGLRLPLRVVRKDLVRRCGPLGGIYSALKTTKAFAVVFVPCDMPFLSAMSLRRCLAAFDGQRPVFAVARWQAGFPIILPVALRQVIKNRIDVGKFALHELACVTGARLVRLPAKEVFNINTPEDLAEAQKRCNSAQEQLVKRR